MTPYNNAHLTILYLGCLNDDPETQFLLVLKCAPVGGEPRIGYNFSNCTISNYWDKLLLFVSEVVIKVCKTEDGAKVSAVTKCNLHKIRIKI